MADNIFLGTFSNLWAASNNWSLSATPTSTDGHVAVLSATSPSVTVSSVARQCNHLMCTGYTGTLTLTTQLTVSGDITLDSGMAIAGASNLVPNNNGNLISNGKVVPNLQFAGTNKTFTLLDDWSASTLSLNGTTTLTINGTGTTLYSSSDITVSAAGCAGTAKIVANGTGLLSTTAAIQNDLDINTTGTTTLGGSLRYSTGLFRHISGTVDTTTNNSTFTIGLSNVTTTRIDTSGISWNHVSTPFANTIIGFVSDLNVYGLYTNSSSVTLSGANLNIYGGFTTGGGTNLISTGGTKVRFVGTNCYWASGSGQNRINVDILPAGTFTLTGTSALVNVSTIKYISGNTNTTGGTLSAVGSISWEASGMTWDNLICTQTNQTLNEPLYAKNLTVCVAGNVNFLGDYGFTVDNLYCTTANRNISLKTGLTYNINSGIYLKGNAAPSTSPNSITLLSNTTSAPSYLNLSPTGTCNVMWTRVIDIDSSGGREMYTANGLITRTTNWVRTNPDMFKFFDY